MNGDTVMSPAWSKVVFIMLVLNLRIESQQNWGQMLRCATCFIMALALVCRTSLIAATWCLPLLWKTMWFTTTKGTAWLSWSPITTKNGGFPRTRAKVRGARCVAIDEYAENRPDVVSSRLLTVLLNHQEPKQIGAASTHDEPRSAEAKDCAGKKWQFTRQLSRNKEAAGARAVQDLMEDHVFVSIQGNQFKRNGLSDFGTFFYWQFKHFSGDPDVFPSRVLSCLNRLMNRFLGKLQAGVEAIAAVMSMQHFFLYIFETFNAVALLVSVDINAVVQCFSSDPKRTANSPYVLHSRFYFRNVFFFLVEGCTVDHVRYV